MRDALDDMSDGTHVDKEAERDARVRDVHFPSERADCLESETPRGRGASKGRRRKRRKRKRRLREESDHERREREKGLL